MTQTRLLRCGLLGCTMLGLLYAIPTAWSGEFKPTSGPNPRIAALEHEIANRKAATERGPGMTRRRIPTNPEYAGKSLVDLEKELRALSMEDARRLGAAKGPGGPAPVMPVNSGNGHANKPPSDPHMSQMMPMHAPQNRLTKNDNGQNPPKMWY